MTESNPLLEKRIFSVVEHAGRKVFKLDEDTATSPKMGPVSDLSSSYRLLPLGDELGDFCVSVERRESTLHCYFAGIMPKDDQRLRLHFGGHLYTYMAREILVRIGASERPLWKYDEDIYPDVHAMFAGTFENCTIEAIRFETGDTITVRSVG